MKKLLIVVIFSVILFFGILTRFYKLGEAPAGLYLDEAAQGYNAYSILKTGKDEFGKALPAVFRSFVDFKTPVYIYLVVPLIPVFDLTPLTVRLPSFIFSMLTFPILFLLLRKISPAKLAIPLSLMTILLLAISPWHVLFGRTNFECNVALFFFLAGVYLFYKGLERPIWLILGAVMLAIAIPAYHSQRIITPVILLLLFLRYRRQLFSPNLRRYTTMSLVIGLFISLPTLAVVLTPGFLARAAGLNIFSFSHLPAGFIENYQGLFGFIINSRWFLSAWEFASLYVSYFSPRNMFVLGDAGLRSSFPELATFFVWQFPFYIYGLYLLVKKKDLGELRFLTIVLLLVSPIPAALTRDPYSTIRALPLVVPQLVVISLGMLGFWDIFRSRILSLTAAGPAGSSRRVLPPPKAGSPALLNLVFAIIPLAILVIYSVAKLYSSVIILNEHFRGFYWDYGWEEVVKTVKGELNHSLPVIVDNTRFEPYSQFLFFLKYPPDIYQRENFEVPLSEYYTDMQRNRTKKIGHITTRAISWEEDLLTEQYLVGDNLSISPQQIEEHQLILVKEIFYPDKSVAFRIVKTQPKI